MQGEYRLVDFAGAPPTRPSVYMVACMVRPACATFEDTGEMHGSLASHARECATWGSACSATFARGLGSSGFCSDPLFASKFERLTCASRCKPASAKVSYEWKAQGCGPCLPRKVFNVLPMPTADPWTQLMNSRLSVLGGERCE